MRRYVLSKKYIVNLNSGTDGYQPKYFRNGYWYKQDVLKGEGDVENIISRLLRYSSLPKSTYVYYESCIINGKQGCRSKTFLRDNEEFLSFDSIYLSFSGGNLPNDLAKLGNAKDRYNSLLNIGKSYCSLDLSIYFKVTFLIDMLVENTDRHTKNIGVIYNKDLRKFRIAPVFDNGRSLGIGISPDETPCARTISGSFANQVTATCGFPVKSVFKIDYNRCLRDPVILSSHKSVDNLTKYKAIFKM